MFFGGKPPLYSFVCALARFPLARCCQAGKDVADQVAGTPGMLAALKTVLDAPPPSTPEIPARPDAPGAEIAGEGSVGEWRAQAANATSRPASMR